MLHLLRQAERWIIVCLFLAMVVLFFGNVLVRELLPGYAGRMAWSEEAVRRMNTVMVFMTLGLALERGRHIAVDTFRDRLPRSLRLWLVRLIDVMGVLFSAYMAWLAFVLARFVLSTGQRSPTLGMEIGWLYVAPLVGFLLLALRYALSLAGGYERHMTFGPDGEA